MKLVHPNFLFPIEFEENKITTVVIESPKIFQKYLGELYQQTEGELGKWVLSHESELMEIKKFCEVIINPYALDMNNRKVLGKLYEDIKKDIMHSEKLLRWNTLYPYITELMEELIEDFDYHLEYTEEIEIKDFLKLMNLHVRNHSIDMTEKLIDYINLYHTLLGTKLFVLVNIKSYLEEKQLKYLYEQAFYHKFNLLLIENYENKVENKCELRYIIDKDNCAIYS